MSIIHDALKKLQQGFPPKADEKAANPDEKPANPTVKTPPPNPFAYDVPAKNETAAPLAEQQSKEPDPPVANKIKTILAMLCAFAITLGALIFLYKELHTYYPTAKRMVKTVYNQWLHKMQKNNPNPPPPPPLPPLAKITVSPAAAAAAAPTALPVTTAAPNTAAPPAVADTPKPEVPQTLDVHGVMSNGKNNLVLINDQVYQEGDDVDGIKIVKIDLDYITINDNGKEEKIRVKN